MEAAYTLIITWYVGSWWTGWTPMEHRTPGLMEIECKLYAAGVKSPKKAKCVHEPVAQERDICRYIACYDRPGRPIQPS